MPPLRNLACLRFSVITLPISSMQVALATEDVKSYPLCLKLTKVFLTWKKDEGNEKQKAIT